MSNKKFISIAKRDVPFPVDYPAYLSKHDVVYLSPPTEGYEGFPLGNGDIGAMVWTTKTGLQAQINKNDTWDEPNDEAPMLLRSCGQLSVDFTVPCFDWLYLDDFEGRLSMHDAEATFSTTTPFLSVSVNSRVQVNRNVFLIECQTEGRGDLSEEGAMVRVALERWGSRAFPSWYSGITRGAHLGLGNAKAGAGKGDIWIEESFKDLSFAVVCRVIGQKQTDAAIAHRHRAEISLPAKPNHQFTVMVSVVTTYESPEPLNAAVALLDECEKVGFMALCNEHRAWWADFWQRSFVHLGNDYLENLYYMHMYLMGSSSRGRYPVVFNAGTFTWNHDVRQWVTPHHWNMQQAYWSMNAANHSNLLRPYLDTYWRLMPKAEAYAKSRGFENAILWNEGHDFSGRMLLYPNNFTPASQIAQFFWDYYQYTGALEFLKERTYPFMKRAAEFYLQYLKWDEEKKQYEIYPAAIYECPQGDHFRNTITDLAMIRTLFRACIEASEILGIDQAKREQWQKVLDHLAPYPLLMLPEVGEALAVGLNPDQSVANFDTDDEYTFCRNTASVFPAGDIGISRKGSRLYEAAVRRAKLHPKNKLAISPIATVKARLGLADDARDDLLMSIRQLQHFPQGLFYNLDHWYYLSRYADVAKNPIIDCQRDYIYDREARYKHTIAGQRINTPAKPFIQCGLEPSAILAVTVNEMLLQSHEGLIRVFPATPNDWPAVFTLKARGGFLVSAQKQKGAPASFVLIKSLLGNECRLANPWPDRKVFVQDLRSGGKQPHAQTSDGVLTFDTAIGGIYLISSTNQVIDLSRLTRFSGQPNTGPKFFKEAVLGKPRDF